MPPPPPQVHGAPEQSIPQKMLMGATMGGMVGITIGALFGTVAILRSGAGPRGFLPSLSGYMLSSAATFGFFMSIGSVIRTDGELTLQDWANRDYNNNLHLLSTSSSSSTTTPSPVGNNNNRSNSRTMAILREKREEIRTMGSARGGFHS